MKGKGDFGDIVIHGDQFHEFKVAVTDMKGVEKDFLFTPKGIGGIISHTIAKDTKSLVKRLLKFNEIPVLIEVNEISYPSKKEDMDELIIELFLDREYGQENNFIYRLTEKEEEFWVLSFVFNDEEIQSMPAKWEGLSY